MNEMNEFKDILSALIEDENSVRLTPEEQKMLDEVMELFNGFDKNLQSLREAKANGLTRDEWLTQKLTESVSRIAKTEEEQEKLISVINESAIEALGQTAGELPKETAKQNELAQQSEIKEEKQ